MDLSLLSPEVRKAIASADIDKICNMAELVRGKDTYAYQVLLKVIEGFRLWSDFEVAKGPEGIAEGARIMVKMAKERHNLVLPDTRAKELVRLVYLMHKTFGLDTENFFNWLLDQTVAQQPKKVVRPINAR